MIGSAASAPLRIDAHQHFWRYNDRDYVWMREGMDILRRDYLPEELTAAQHRIGFDGSIAVQARMTLEETEFLLDLADTHDRIKGVVGYVDLCAADVDAQLDRVGAYPRLVGIRHVVHDEPDDRFMLRARFLRGLGRLARRGLAYDLLLFPRHLPVACDVVGRCPDLRFVVDHIAKPGIKAGVVSPWDDDLRRLAAFANVGCKLSGLVTEADWGGWRGDDFTRYLDVVLEAFGPSRVMIGSDWPVCLVAGSYDRVMGLVIEYVSRLSHDEQARILGGSCLDWYGIAAGAR